MRRDAIAGKIRAFTFIELVVAVTVFSIIAVTIYSTFNAGIRIWLKTSPMIEANQAARVFFNLISSDLKNSVKYIAGTDSVNFEGEPYRISFITLVSLSGEGAASNLELARVTYLFDPETNCLKRLVASGREGLKEENARSFDVLRNIAKEDFGFEYCFKEVSGEGDYTYRWEGNWSNNNEIPRGVRVKVGEFKKTIFIPTGRLGSET